MLALSDSFFGVNLPTFDWMDKIMDFINVKLKWPLPREHFLSNVEKLAPYFFCTLCPNEADSAVRNEK